MQELFAHEVYHELGVKKTDRILVAVSGGADSVVLLRLFHALGHPVAVAHCNFQLREKESDDDETFVRTLAENLELECYVKGFDTVAFVSEHKVSIQEAARTLRYEWFSELMHSEKFDFVATGHSKTDHLETVFINQIRGTGPKGLEGIVSRPEAGILRPLLPFSSENIRECALTHSWGYRKDSSNDSSKYLRNRIRQELFPSLINIEPSIEHIVASNSVKIKEHNELLKHLLQSEIQKITIKNGGETRILISDLDSYPHPHLVLYTILVDKGFNREQSYQICNTNQTGATIQSDSHSALIDRGYIVIRPRLSTPKIITIDSPGAYRFGETTILVTEKSGNELDLKTSKHTCLVLPSRALEARSWEEGDRIQPFGMKGSKLISDVFGDSKIPNTQKNQIPIFVRDNTILWVGGLCFSETGRIQKESHTVLWEIQLITPPPNSSTSA